jgi:2-keto-4-pentenoate hydratase
MNSIEQIAKKIYRAEISKQPIAPIRTFFTNERDIEAAYKIQQLVTQKKLADGAKIIGKKVGLTSFAVQEQLGVDEPDFGILTQDMQIENHGEVNSKQLMQPKAEAEWAFVLKEDLNATNLDIDKITKAIDYACVAIEIVGSRIENWNIKITDTIADNASASHFVLGDERIELSNINLEGCKMQLFKNDELVSEGTGKACMGNPLNAVLWLAQAMQKRNQPLKAGEVILSGALGPMINLSKGDKILTKIDDFIHLSLYIS